MEGWLAYLDDLYIPEDNLAWAKVALTAELFESLEPYSPLILPNFNEEEYMNQPAQRGGWRGDSSKWDCRAHEASNRGGSLGSSS